MSLNWHYFAVMNRRPLVMFPKSTTGTQKEMLEFTKHTQQKAATVTGRPWRAEELRLKSHSDLHKLWYVLLKEKNRLKSDFLYATQLQQEFYGHNDLVKVNLSMSRLLTVVNERKKLRNEYRKHLEDQYIAMKKQEEKEAFEKEREKLREEGKEVPLSEEERLEKVKQKTAAKKEKMKEAIEEFKSISMESETASPLGEKDFKLMGQQKAKLSQGEILRQYVSNWADLDLKQRRKVMAKIQSQRAMHAKEIFLKELATLGRKMGEQPDSLTNC